MKQVQLALKDLGVPVSVGVWRPTTQSPNPPPQYLVYSSTMREDEHYDDQLVSTITFVYLSLWSAVDPTAMVLRVRDAMRAAGFELVEETDRGYNQPAYDTATELFSVYWTWSLFTEVHDGD